MRHKFHVKYHSYDFIHEKRDMNAPAWIKSTEIANYHSYDFIHEKRQYALTSFDKNDAISKQGHLQPR